MEATIIKFGEQKTKIQDELHRKEDLYASEISSLREALLQKGFELEKSKLIVESDILIYTKRYMIIAARKVKLRIPTPKVTQTIALD